MDYKVIKSARKTISLEVRPDLTVVVKAPLRMRRKEISAFVQKHEEWLKDALVRTQRRALLQAELDTPQRQKRLQREAEEYLPQRTEYWAKIMQVSPAGIRITDAKTRFGSCSAKNRICYSRRLMAYPQQAVDYVIVHELAHILQKDHSPRFYAIVQRYLPDWKERRNLLK